MGKRSRRLKRWGKKLRRVKRLFSVALETTFTAVYDPVNFSSIIELINKTQEFTFRSSPMFSYLFPLGKTGEGYFSCDLPIKFRGYISKFELIDPVLFPDEMPEGVFTIISTWVGLDRAKGEDFTAITEVTCEE